MDPKTDDVKQTSREFPLVGILGGGQLGRMLALAGIRMGIRIRFLSPTPAGPMQGLGEVMVGNWNDHDVLRRFADGCAAVTVESEWAPADRLADVVPAGIRLWPDPETIRNIRHKGTQKDRLASAGLPLPPYRRCGTLDEARETADSFGYPVLFKKYEGSYDGYGNATIEEADSIGAAWRDLAGTDGLLVEAWAPFVRELAVLVVRSEDGRNVTYPVAHTIQKDHRCHTVIVPAATSERVAAEARRVAVAAVEAVRGVGTVAVEMFEMHDGSVLVNELAPRPHNTGHYSIEACYTSQFENHLRAVLGWPLGLPALREPAAVMVNLLGKRSGKPSLDGMQRALAIPGVSVHIYGKYEVKPNRKMGHVTVTGAQSDEALARALEAEAAILL